MEKLSREQFIQWLAEVVPNLRNSYMHLFGHGAQDFDACYRVQASDPSRRESYSMMYRRGDEYYRVRTTREGAGTMAPETQGSNVHLHPPRVPKLPLHIAPVVFSDTNDIDVVRSASQLTITLKLRVLNPSELTYSAMALQLGTQAVVSNYRVWQADANGEIEMTVTMGNLPNTLFPVGANIPVFAWLYIVAPEITTPTEASHFIRTSTLAAVFTVIKGDTGFDPPH